MGMYYKHCFKIELKIEIGFPTSTQKKTFIVRIVAGRIHCVPGNGFSPFELLYNFKKL